MPNIQSFFMKTTFMLSQLSHCVSHKVGALIVKDNRIISMGYNGTPSGSVHCDKIFDINNFDREKHYQWSKLHEVHAEMNSMAFAAKNGLEVQECDMYTTISPCDDCLKNIIPSGILNIYYFELYDKSNMNLDMLKKINIEQIKDPNGEIAKFIKINNLKN